jgi:hypothetical protein
VLTGHGADIILIDDPLKPEEKFREATNDYGDPGGRAWQIGPV